MLAFHLPTTVDKEPQKATSLLDGSRVVARSKLVGGHSAGGLDGLT